MSILDKLRALLPVGPAAGNQPSPGSPPPPAIGKGASMPSRHDDFHDFFRLKILPYEGGYVVDHAGMTNMGVIAATWATFKGVPVETVTEAEMRALTPDDVEPVYRKLFWDALRCGELPRGVGISVFDHACGAGLRRAAQMLQRLVGTTPDGAIGPLTIAAASRMNAEGLINRYRDARLAYYASLTDTPNGNLYAKYGRGWDRRARETAEWAKARLGDAP